MKKLLLGLFSFLAFSCLSQTNQLIITDPTKSYPGQENTIIGILAGNLANATKPFSNVIIGKESAHSISDGARNILIGHNSGRLLTSGKDNVFVGHGSGQNNSNGNKNIFIGTVSTANADNNIIIGSRGNSSRIFQNNVILGEGRFSKIKGDWTNNVMIGNNAGGFIDSVMSGAVMIGSLAGAYAQTPGIMIGPLAGQKNTGFGAICVGGSAGEHNKKNYNIFMGYGAGQHSDMEECVVLGQGAVKPKKHSNISSSSYSVFIGNSCGANDIKSDHGVYIGHLTAHNFGGGNGNVFVGSTSAIGHLGQDSISISKGSNNTFFGTGTGMNIIDLDSNVFLGSYAGHEIQNGTGNIFIGSHAGHELKTTSNNLILIGAGTQSDEGVNNSIALGTDTKLTESNSLIVNQSLNVGIGTSSPKNKVEINSSMADVSGLRFTNLTSTSTAGLPTEKVLTVNENGDVVLNSLPTDLEFFRKQIELMNSNLKLVQEENKKMQIALSGAEDKVSKLEARVKRLEDFHKCKMKKEMKAEKS